MSLNAPETALLGPVLAALPESLHRDLTVAVDSIAAGRIAEQQMALAETESRVLWMSGVLGGVAAAVSDIPGVGTIGMSDLPATVAKTKKAALARGWDGR